MRKNLRVLSLAAIGLLLLTLTMYWLWQRQPQTSQLDNLEPALEGTTSIIEKESFGTKPPDATVVTTPDIKFEGQTSAGYLVVIYSNDFQVVKRASEKGNYSANLKLSPGLNLLDIVSISPDLAQDQKKSVTLYLADAKSDEETGQTVFAGLVKSIFDTLLSVTTVSGAKNIRTSQSTDFTIPDEEEQEATNSPVKNIRIGDYVIALGNAPPGGQDQDTIIAASIEVIRENKPQNSKQLAVVKIITGVRENSFTAKNLKDNQLIPFTLDKKSTISKDDQEIKAADITKDQNAIIIYHTSSDKNIVDLVYLLP